MFSFYLLGLNKGKTTNKNHKLNFLEKIPLISADLAFDPKGSVFIPPSAYPMFTLKIKKGIGRDRKTLN